MNISPGLFQSGTNQYGVFHYTTRSINGNSINYAPVISLGSQPGPTNFPVVPLNYNSNTAIITLPTSTTLAYGRSYYVQMDPGVFVDTNGAAYPGISDTTSWTFTVKASGPTNGTTNIVVGNDGTTTDFSTLEGAAEFVPTSNTAPTTVTVRKGFYPEVVYWKSPNVTIQGQGRTNTVIAFINNNYINPSTSTRPVMDVVTTNVTLQDLAIYNMTPYNGSQAETLYTSGSSISLKRVGLYSYQDTLLANAGSCFVTDSYIEGNVDYMWGTAATYLQRCELRANTNNGSAVAGYSQARNASNGYGFSFVNCTLDAYPGVTNNSYSLSRSFSASYPFNQTAYINCRMGPHIVPAGWQLYDGTGITSQLWEYQSRDLSNNPLNVSGRPTYNRSFSVSGTNIVYTAGQTNSPDVLPNQQISTALAGIMANASQILGWTPTASPDAAITLNNASQSNCFNGTVFVDAGATVVDPVDGTINILGGSGTVNTSSNGIYTITYGYTNSLNIPATPVTRTVNVISAPSYSPASLSQTYTGSGISVTLTNTNPPYLVTYNGSTSLPVAAGSYTVIATVTDTNAYPPFSVTNTLLIAQAPVVLQFANTNQPYNGYPRTVTVSSTPSAAAFNITYAGSQSAPSNAGTYALQAAANDPNYSGTGVATLSIYDPTALWRQNYYGTTNNSGTAADAAPTRSGYDNYHAYTLGVDPSVPSTNRALLITQSSNTVVLSFTAKSAGTNAWYSGLNRYYTIESCTNLTNPVWKPLSGCSNILGADQTVLFTTNVSGGTNLFFHLKAWLQ
jgi:hypothetical protein